MSLENFSTRLSLTSLTLPKRAYNMDLCNNELPLESVNNDFQKLLDDIICDLDDADLPPPVISTNESGHINFDSHILTPQLFSTNDELSTADNDSISKAPRVTKYHCKKCGRYLSRSCYLNSHRCLNSIKKQKVSKVSQIKTRRQLKEQNNQPEPVPGADTELPKEQTGELLKTALASAFADALNNKNVIIIFKK